MGAVLGGGALLVETLVLGSPLRGGALAAYALCGGFAAASTRGLAELWIPGFGARAACLIALSAFAILHLAYFANVKILPMEPYWTARSVLLDLLLAAVVLYAAWRVLRSDRAQEWRLRFGRLAAVCGALAIVVSLGGLAGEWPRTVPAPPKNGQGPDLLLVVMDSARRDSLGLYGSPRPTSPALDIWASRGRVFTQALSASSWTVPTVHQLLQTAQAQGSLARRLARRGYATGCFTDNPHLHSRSPILTGFDRIERSVGRWRGVIRGTVFGETIERLDPGDDARLVRRAGAWLESQGSPVFLYVHLMDSHTPYRHPPIDGRRRPGRHIEFPGTGMVMTADEAEDVVARYEGGIRSADQAAGQLLDLVAGRGRPWLAIVTSDHGESLGEEGRWFHGGSLAPELLAVPMLVLGSGVAPGRLHGVVGHAAIPETLAQAAGLLAGVGLTDLRVEDGPGVAEGSLPPRLVYRVQGDHKLVVDSVSRRTSLFNWRRDPGEKVDLAQRDPLGNESLVRELSRQAPLPPVTILPEQVERLKALGYSATGLEQTGSH